MTGCKRYRSTTIEVRDAEGTVAIISVPPVDNFNQPIEGIDADYYARLKAKYIIGMTGSLNTRRV